MARRILKWKEDNGILSLISAANDEQLATFDLREVFPEFDAINEVQKYIVVFGVKQSLSDDSASDDTERAKFNSIVAGWKSLVTGDMKTRRSTGANLETKLAEAEAALKTYIDSSDSDKLLAAKFGINRTLLQKAVDKIKKQIEKRDSGE